MSLFAAIGGGDIWSGAGFAFSSPINDLLERGNFTLSEILVEDEVLQEVKGQNAKLIEFLARKDTVAELVSFIVEPYPEGATDARRFKYPYMASEIICCETPVILDTLAQFCLPLLFSILEHPPDSLDHYRSGYLGKVTVVLLKHKCQALVSYINAAGEGLFQSFLQHISNYSVMQILRRMLLPKAVALQDIDPSAAEACAEELDFAPGPDAPAVWFTWSENASFMRMLIRILCDSGRGSEKGGQAGEASHVSELLVSLIPPSPATSGLLKILYEPSVLESLSELGCSSLSSSESSLEGAASASMTDAPLAALRVLQALIDKLIPSQPVVSPSGNTSATLSTTPEECAATLANVPPNSPISRTDVIQDEVIFTSFAQCTVPRLCTCMRVEASSSSVGPVRLQMSRILRSCVELDRPVIDKALVLAGAFEAMLRMFFRYDNCSMLHQAVCDAVISALQGTTSERCDLQRNLIVDCHLLDQLRQAILDNEAGMREGKKRRGFIGHIFKISEALYNVIHSGEGEETSANSTFIASLLTSDSCKEWWEEFSSTTLAEVTSLHNKPLGNFPVPEKKDNKLSQDFGDEGLIGMELDSSSIASLLERLPDASQLPALPTQEPMPPDLPRYGNENETTFTMDPVPPVPTQSFESSGWANFDAGASVMPSSDFGGFADFSSAFGGIETPASAPMEDFANFANFAADFSVLNPETPKDE